MRYSLRAFIILFLSFVCTLSYTVAHAGETTVSTQWLETQLDNPNVIVIDMSDESQYQRFHIKKAIQLPYHVLNQRLKNGVSLSIGRQNITKLLGLLGITPDSHVVVYDDTGGLHAARLFWELERLQHKKISLLDGGLVKWILEGKPVTAIPFQPKKKTNYPLPNKMADIHLANINEVLPSSRSQNTLLIDVRSEQEYIGNIKQRRSGHIPGAKLWSWDNSIDFDNQFKFKSKQVIEKELSSIGLNKKTQPIVLYCRSAHRAAQSYLTLRHLGFKNIKVYDGSMSQYEKTANAPLTRGKEP